MDPEDHLIKAELCELCIETGDYDEAKRLIAEQKIEDKPYVTWVKLEHLLTAKEREADLSAESDWGRTQALYREIVDAYREGKIEHVIEALKEVQELNPDDEVVHALRKQAYVNQYFECKRDGKVHHAVRAAKNASDMDPDDKRLKAMYISSLLSLGAYPNARKVAIEERRKDRDAPEWCTLIASSYMREGEYSQAIANAITALRLQPDAVATHGMLAQLYLMTRQPEKAAQHIAFIEENEPENEYLANYKITQTLLDGKLSDAKAVLMQSLQKNFIPANVRVAQRMAANGILPLETYNTILDMAKTQELMPARELEGLRLEQSDISEVPNIDMFVRRAFNVRLQEEQRYDAANRLVSALYKDDRYIKPVSSEAASAAGWGGRVSKGQETGENYQPDFL